MPRFNYTAIGADGRTIHGTVTAESPYAARKQLRSRNIHPTGLAESASEKEGRTAILSSLGIGSKTRLIEFTKQLSTLLNAEIKLTEALSVLVQQVDDVRFRNAIIDIRDRVVTGESLTDAMGDYSDYFDIIYISMVRVGEVTGSLGSSFATISSFMEKRQRVESKLITVMIYPVIVMVACVVAIIILTTVVIPKITEQIKQTGQELPTITKVMMGISDIMLHWWFVVIGVVVLMFWGYKKFIKTERGRYLRDKTILGLPIFGPLIRQRVVSRFASTLSTLLSSGLSMAESLRVVAEVTGNVIMSKAVRQARERILSGADIATPLRESGVLSPAVAHMVAVGEKSGELELMLKRISENLESSTDIVIERLAAAIEPLIIIVLVVVIGLIAYATLAPILQFSSKL
jgi:type II secretory pathway component PulF